MPPRQAEESARPDLRLARERALPLVLSQRHPIQHRWRLDVADALPRHAGLLSRHQPRARDGSGFLRRVCSRLPRHGRAEDLVGAAAHTLGATDPLRVAPRERDLPPAGDHVCGRRAFPRRVRRLFDFHGGTVHLVPQGSAASALDAGGYRDRLRPRRHAAMAKSAVDDDHGYVPARGSVALSRVSLGTCDGGGDLPVPASAGWNLRRTRTRCGYPALAPAT